MHALLRVLTGSYAHPRPLRTVNPLFNRRRYGQTWTSSRRSLLRSRFGNEEERENGNENLG